MPKVTARAAVLTACLLLALTGCAGTPDSAPGEPERATTAQQEPEPAVSATPEPEDSPAPVAVTPIETAAATGDAPFVARAADLVRGFGYEVTDEQLLTAGQYACQQLQAGASPESITALEGVTAAINERFALDAQELLCP